MDCPWNVIGGLTGGFNIKFHKEWKKLRFLFGMGG